MADISTSTVKELREETGVGMMECKKALVEAHGDKAAAVKILRESGMASPPRRPPAPPSRASSPPRSRPTPSPAA